MYKHHYKKGIKKPQKLLIEVFKQNKLRRESQE